MQVTCFMLSTVFSPFLSPPSSPQPALEELLVEFFVPQHLNYSGKNFLDAKKNSKSYKFASALLVKIIKVSYRFLCSRVILLSSAIAY